MSYGNYPDLSKIKKILIIKFRHLGDVLLTSPIFTILKDRFPGVVLDMYVYKNTKEMLTGHPDISEVFTYDRKTKKLGINKKVFCH